MSEPTPTAKQPPQSGSSKRSWLPIIPIIGGVLLLLAAVALILFIGLRALLRAGEASPGISLPVVRLTSTPVVSPTETPACETIISSGDVQVAAPLPISLTVGSQAFPVEAIGPGQAEYPEGRAGATTWVCGTVVNYVLGLEPSAENEALLAGLRPGDEIGLLLSNGVGLSFRFTEQREATAYEASVFEQFHPRLTLILEKASGAWQIVAADYFAETAPAQPPPGTLVQPGQPVRVGNAQVTVVRGHAESGLAGLTPETMYYLVEFTVENVGTAPLDADAFNIELHDGLGNGYLLSTAASAFGEYGVLGGEIAPGAVAQGSAGYLVPDGLAGPTLTWTFGPQPGSELRASVSIPYEATTQPTGEGSAQVTVTDAFLSGDGAALIVEGEVRNVGDGLLIVELGDIALSSSAGMGNLRMAAPPLPWTIQPGQAQIVELQYDKPAAPTVLLTLMGYSFEIGGLQ
jgi:hypothetical protein